MRNITWPMSLLKESSFNQSMIIFSFYSLWEQRLQFTVYESSVYSLWEQCLQLMRAAFTCYSLWDNAWIILRRERLSAWSLPEACWSHFDEIEENCSPEPILVHVFVYVHNEKFATNLFYFYTITSKVNVDMGSTLNNRT